MLNRKFSLSYSPVLGYSLVPGFLWGRPALTSQLLPSQESVGAKDTPK